MSASSRRSRPVISQSIQMMRSEEVEELTPVTIAIRPTGDGSDHRVRLPVNHIAAMSTPPSHQPAWHREQVEAVTGGHLRQPPMPQQQPPPQQHPNRPQPTWPTQRYTPQYVPAQAHANPTVRPGLRTWLGGGAIGVVSLVLAL